jgi:hypothetical protein
MIDGFVDLHPEKRFGEPKIQNWYNQNYWREWNRFF